MSQFDRDRVIFIGGSGRSGTTILAQLLDKLPSVASIFEVPSLVSMIRQVRDHNKPFDEFIELLYDEMQYCTDKSNEYNWHLNLDESIALIDVYLKRVEAGVTDMDCIRFWGDEVHTIQMIRDSGAFRIVHKTPLLSAVIPELINIWPESFFLHIIRHPEAVIASYLNQDFGPNTLEQGINWYCYRVGSAINQGRGLINYFELRFEDLCNAPVETLKAIQIFTDLQGDTESLIEAEPLEKDKINKWDKFFNRAEKEQIRRKIHEQLPALGELYEDFN
jgi:hypothetical protein